jgi:eukaryotic-like serine/threonine-protein kinase
MQTPDGDRIGKQIGSYRIKRELGSGAAGAVYEAEHVENGTLVALKVLHPQHHGSDAAARFAREGKTLGLFQHRNIVEVLEVGVAEDGTRFLAMELVRGVSLRALMNDGYIAPRRALTIMRQVVDALGAAHAVGVVHRDVKPENIMLADGGSSDGTDLVKVLDFGVAKLLADTEAILGESKLTRTGMSVFGTADYVAPEIVLGQPLDGRSDLYAAGAVLYELLAGTPVFQASDPQQLLRKHLTATVQPLNLRAPDRTFTPALELVVAEALQKNADQRFRSAAEMTAAIDGALLSLDTASLSSMIAPTPAPLQGVDAATVPASASYEAQALATSAPPASTNPPSSLFPVRQRASARSRLMHLVQLLQKHRLAVGAACGTLVVIAIVAVILKSGGSSAPSPDNDPHAFLSLGHERLTAGRRVDALNAYERAIRLSREVAKTEALRESLTKILESKDGVAAVLALELLTQIDPPARSTIAAYAASGKLADVRHRALAIAERDGFLDSVDRLESVSLDLSQATTCDDRRAAIEKLAQLSDKRAVSVLKKAKAYKCVEKDASAAIARIESGG